MLNEAKTFVKGKTPQLYYLLQGMRREVTNKLMYPKLLTIELTEAKLAYQMAVTSIQEEVVVNGAYFSFWFSLWAVCFRQKLQYLRKTSLSFVSILFFSVI